MLKRVFGFSVLGPSVLRLRVLRAALAALVTLTMLPPMMAAAQGLQPPGLQKPDLQKLGAPSLQSCEVAVDKNWCRHGLQSMQKELPGARQGNYQAMRNVAWCMVDGCEGAVRRDRAGGCAWRRAIMQLHGHQGGRADRSDETNLAQCTSWGL
jgi:hypothetical protein